MAISPGEFIRALYGKPVIVKLNSGLLSSLDGNMNLALEECSELFHGELKKVYKDAFVRGNNVLYISNNVES